MPAPHKYHHQIDLAVDNAHTRVIQLVGSGKQVLDLGCATGYMAKVLVECFGCTVTGIERDADAAEEARKVCRRVIVGDLDTLDFARELGVAWFDVVVCADVLEHLHDPVRVLAALRAFLAPAGYVVASIPNVAHLSVVAELLEGRFPYRPFGLLDETHLRFFTRDSVYACFERAGLLVTHLDRLQVEPEATEFRSDLSRFPDNLVRLMRADEDSTTYQFIVTAHPHAGAGADGHLGPPEPDADAGVPSAWPAASGPVDAARGRHEALRGRVKYLEAERDRQARELEDARGRIDDLEQEGRARTGHIGFLQGEVAQLQDHVRYLEGEAHALQARLADIEAGVGWRLLQRARRVRLGLFPRGSRRERAYLTVLRTLLRACGRHP